MTTQDQKKSSHAWLKNFLTEVNTKIDHMEKNVALREKCAAVPLSRRAEKTRLPR